MIEKIKAAGNFTLYVIEGVICLFTEPFVIALDWLAKQWLSKEIKDKENFTEFLETALADQRISLSKYISENKALSERLSKYEKYGEHATHKHTEWLNSEIARLAGIVRQVSNNNEALHNDNMEMRVAGNELAELLANNKPKKRLTKKDKEVQKAVENWNKASV